MTHLKFKTASGREVEIEGNKIKIDISGGKIGAVDSLAIFTPSVVHPKIKMYGGVSYFTAIIDGSKANIWLDAENAAIVQKHNDQQRKEADKKLLKMFPGLDQLQKAHQEIDEYFYKFNAAMEDENNDGVNMPIHPKANIEYLEAKYPKAALYLKALGFQNASNFRKVEAGKYAKELLDNDVNLKEVEAVLDNWHKDCFLD